MTKDEALKLALEKIATVNAMDYEYQAWAKEALALTSTQCEKQPAQEPIVGTKTWFEDGKIVTQNLRHSDVYTTPPAAPMQEPKFVRMVDGVPCITLVEHKHLMAAKEKNT